MPKNAVSKTVNMLIDMLIPKKLPNTPAITKPKKPNTEFIKSFRPSLIGVNNALSARTAISIKNT